MMVNICVWDARFSAGCRNPDLLWPLNSLAYSLTSLHRLVFPTFCHLSFVISQHIHGSSSLAALPNPRQVSARARTNICQQNKSLTWHPGNFFSFAATWREYKGTKQSCACHVSAPKETIISYWHEDAAFWLLHIARSFSYHKTKVSLLS